MLTINVAPDGSGQFTTISEAVLAVPYDCPAVIRIAPGIYREKLVCEKKDITLAGAGMDATRLVWNDGGKLPHPDGRPTHTFRSYTAFFSGEKLRVEDMTIENDAGPGAKAGQAIAAYVDSARAAFDRVRLLGNQDTLFCAPLPEKEREKDGFLGPRGLAPRRASAQYYHACEIAGDIDFIFGSDKFDICFVFAAKSDICFSTNFVTYSKSALQLCDIFVVSCLVCIKFIYQIFYTFKLRYIDCVSIFCTCRQIGDLACISGMELTVLICIRRRTYAYCAITAAPC